jgi:hypothetical protein
MRLIPSPTCPHTSLPCRPCCDWRTDYSGVRDQVTAPDLVDVETVSVLRKRWLARTLSESVSRPPSGICSSCGSNASRRCD